MQPRTGVETEPAARRCGTLSGGCWTVGTICGKSSHGRSGRGRLRIANFSNLPQNSVFPWSRLCLFYVLYPTGAPRSLVPVLDAGHSFTLKSTDRFCRCTIYGQDLWLTRPGGNSIQAHPANSCSVPTSQHPLAWRCWPFYRTGLVTIGDVIGPENVVPWAMIMRNAVRPTL